MNAAHAVYVQPGQEMTGGTSGTTPHGQITSQWWVTCAFRLVAVGARYERSLITCRHEVPRFDAIKAKEIHMTSPYNVVDSAGIPCTKDSTADSFDMSQFFPFSRTLEKLFRPQSLRFS